MRVNTKGFISAFPGIGKSTLHKNGLRYGLYPLTKDGYALYRSIRPIGMSAIYDSDSSEFDKEHFPGNYIKHMIQVLQNNCLDGFVCLVSSHDVVREAMHARGLPFTLVYPDRSLKAEFIERYKTRGSPQAFIDLMEAKWDEFIDSCENDPTDQKIKIGAGQYLVDVI